MKSRRAAIILAIVVLGTVGAIVWFLRSEPEAQRSQHGGMIGALAGFLRSGPESTGAPPPNPEAAKPVVAPKKQPAATAQNIAPAPKINADDLKMDEILRLYPGNTDQSHASAAQSLINLLPTLTPEGQVACAHHISNLIADKDYGRLMHIWRNPTANRAVIEVFAGDLMNRGNQVKLPALLDAMRQPSHPFHEEAKSTLRIFLDGDFGNDFGKWDSAMKAFLQREEAARQAALQAGALSPALPQ
jgi:hypothetical protein